jgi:V/A-type H+-transporting ATPase subunit E
MKTLEKGQDKIDKICAILRDETIEPAKKEAENIIREAKNRADQLIEEAEKRAKSIIAEARSAIEQERAVFQSSLSQAAKQGVEALRQSVEHKFFNESLDTLLEKETATPAVVANLINVIVESIEREGRSTDLTALVSKTISCQEVNKLLLKNVLAQLREHSVVVGNFKGGAQVRLNNEKLTIDMSKEALQELLAHYLRKDFRKLIFV